MCTACLTIFSWRRPKNTEHEQTVEQQRGALLGISAAINEIERQAKATNQRAVHRASVTNTWNSNTSTHSFHNIRVDESGLVSDIDLADLHITMSLFDLQPCLIYSMKRLVLQHNRECTGDISAIANCTGLQTLLLCETSITGNITALRGCESLQILDLQSSMLEGDIAVCGELHNLRTLNLCDNKDLTGDIMNLVTCCVLEDFSALNSPLIEGDCAVFSQTPLLMRLNVSGSKITGSEHFSGLIF